MTRRVPARPAPVDDTGNATGIRYWRPPDGQSASSVVFLHVGFGENVTRIPWPGPDRRTGRTPEVKVMMLVFRGHHCLQNGRARTAVEMRMCAGLRYRLPLWDRWASAVMRVRAAVARPSTPDRRVDSLADRLAQIFRSFGHRIPPFRRVHATERVTSRAGPIAARKLEYTTTVGLVSKCRCNLVWHPAASVRPRSKVQPEANRSL